MRRSPARSALGLCLSLACLALVWHALTLAGWLASRVTAAQGYLRDVRDLTDLAERPGIREAVRSVVASGALRQIGEVPHVAEVALRGGDARGEPAREGDRVPHQR